MTDKTQNLLATLKQTEAGLIADLKALNQPHPVEGQTDPPDRNPRDISITLKALDDVQAQIEKAEVKETSKKYTRWEDLPPPSPEDEARYYEQFKRIFDYVVEADAAGLDLSSDADAPPSMARSRLARSKSEGPEVSEK